MKPIGFAFLVITAGVIIGGCMPGGGSGSKTLLTVDFQKEHTLKYKFTSVRRVAVDWSQGHEMTAGGGRISNFLDSMLMVISYTPVEVDPYGVSTIKASCEQAMVRHETPRAEQTNQHDAVESIRGKTWTFTVDATGRIIDDNELRGVIREAGKKAFRTDTSRGLIKEPDMIYDFIASQWFLWDSVSSIKKPLEGVRVGQQWQSRLLLPTPMFLFTGRDVNYVLSEIRDDPNKGRIAVIKSTYSPFYPVPSEWPLPYTEVFQLSGTFGFLRNYKVLNLQGTGQELFNIDKGRIEQSTQQWEILVSSSLPLEIGPKPQVTVRQTMTMELIGESSPQSKTASIKKQGQ